jgi:hypothetical protein
MASPVSPSHLSSCLVCTDMDENTTCPQRPKICVFFCQPHPTDENKTNKKRQIAPLWHNELGKVLEATALCSKVMND